MIVFLNCINGFPAPGFNDHRSQAPALHLVPAGQLGRDLRLGVC
jgi:hypothetical protein